MTSLYQNSESDSVKSYRELVLLWPEYPSCLQVWFGAPWKAQVWEETTAREVCRGLKAEYSEFFLSRSDSDSASRHSLPVCLLRRETPDMISVIQFDSGKQYIRLILFNFPYLKFF